MNPEIVEVVQEDVNAATRWLLKAKSSKAVNRGDMRSLADAFAEHRLAALTAARPAIMGEAADLIDRLVLDGVDADHLAGAIRAAVKP